ncbi:hypothetical protein C2S53_009711 [Perilla frutescens var. hirtella]|uniref:Uncharacterized protein n=1 Tax=Perilla frutescens var. hirtella TaxID=608512 RepID=A0AAD4P2R1_PERFH|nr:hypothetical protein C2S53_009711 [Perilla frutescens var. hirtella]
MGSEGAVRVDEIMCVNCNCDEEEGWTGPATPEENGEHHHHHRRSDDLLSETPKESLFDSFAPASDKFLLAPRHTKYKQESRNHVVRRLDFDFDFDSTTNDLSSTAAAAEAEEEEEEERRRLFEIVYATIMEAIIAEQEEEEESTTPKSAPRLTGVAETCPPPPMKSARKQRCIDKEICRKLHF